MTIVELWLSCEVSPQQSWLVFSMSTRHSGTEVVSTDILLTSMWYSTVPRYLTTAPGSPTTHWYQIRCVLSQPLYVLAGQSITGRLHLIAHSSQSYTIHLTMSGRWSLPLCLLCSPAFDFDIFLVLLAPKHLGLSIHKNVYLSYMRFILADYGKRDPILNQLIFQMPFSKWINTLMSLKIWVQIHSLGAPGCT